MTFQVSLVENIQGQQIFGKGSPVFPDRIFQKKFVFHFLKAIFDTSFRLSQPFFTLIFYQILSTNILPKKCIENSLENLQVDMGQWATLRPIQMVRFLLTTIVRDQHTSGLSTNHTCTIFAQDIHNVSFKCCGSNLLDTIHREVVTHASHALQL